MMEGREHGEWKEETRRAETRGFVCPAHLMCHDLPVFCSTDRLRRKAAAQQDTQHNDGLIAHGPRSFRAVPCALRPPDSQEVSPSVSPSRTSAVYHNGSENGIRSRAHGAMRSPHKDSPCEAGRIAPLWQVTCVNGVVVIIPSLGVIIMALEVVLGSNPS